MSNSLYIPKLAIAKKIAKEYGTPIFITDAATICERVNLLKTAFNKTKIYYAMKANCNPAILQLMQRIGIDGFDTTSLYEVKLAKKIGFLANDILFTGNNLTDQELSNAHDEKVIVNIGSISELTRYGAMFPKSEIALRINPGAGSGEFKQLITAGKGVKFGIRISEIPDALKIIRRYKLSIIGLHFHLGSGIYRSEQLQFALEKIIKLTKYFTDIRFIDCGGGFGVRYHPNAKPIDLKNFSEVIENARVIIGNKLKRDMEIKIEPGKFLVAESTCLLAEVTSVRKEKNHFTVGINTSLNHIIRPSLYGAYHHMLNLSKPNNYLVKTTVVGNICESTDVLATDIQLPESREGDLITILTAGAYCASMSSLYNLRPYAAEVMIQNNKTELIKRKLSFDEIITSIGYCKNH